MGLRRFVDYIFKKLSTDCTDFTDKLRAISDISDISGELFCVYLCNHLRAFVGMGLRRFVDYIFKKLSTDCTDVPDKLRAISDI